MRKKILISLIVLTVVLGGLAAWFFWSIGKPLYEPGHVRAGRNLRAPLDPPPQSGDSAFWTVEPGIRLHHFSSGKGRPVLFIHGGPGYPVREPLAGLELLTNRFEVHYYDQRGCGRSSRPFDRFTSRNFHANMTELERTLGIGAQVADIERIRRILRQDKLILAGHSFGGFLATMYAVEFPERVEAMVLVAPSGVLVFPEQGNGFYGEVRMRLPESMRAEYDQFTAAYLDFGRLFQKSESELAALNRKAGEYFLIASGQPTGPDLEEAGGWMVQAMYLGLGKRHDYREALRQANAPVLVVHGGNDIVPERTSRLYAELFENGRLHIIQSDEETTKPAGHFVFGERAEEFARVVGEFLEQRR